MLQQLIDYFAGKKILILGFGREGRATLDFLRRFYPDMPLTIADKRQVETPDKNTTLLCGENYLEHINDFDLVMQSPGISLRDVSVSPDTEITGETDLFLRFAPCVKIGVTGSKGKTTTTTLIYDILRAAELPCVIMGNIGTPVFECLDEIEGKTAVIEMSCHQLEFVKASPHIAVLTNLYPEHLDHYNGFEGYAAAKFNIARFQTEGDYFITTSLQEFPDFVRVDSIRAQKLFVGNEAGDDEFLRRLTSANDKLFGKHHHQDIFFAAAAARLAGADEAAIERGIRSFGGIAHRLEKFATIDGIDFYDDAIATIPFAVLSGIEAVGNVGSLIVGGLDRGLDYSEFIEKLAAGSTDVIIGMPETGFEIARELEKSGYCGKIVYAESLESAVDAAFEFTPRGKACLLSPAAASYNYYRNFEEKGDCFKELVRAHGSIA